VQKSVRDLPKDGLLNDWVNWHKGIKLGNFLLKSKIRIHYLHPKHCYQKSRAYRQYHGDFDFNNAGWADLMVYSGKGHDEGLWDSSMTRKGGLTSKNILRFPPVYGSTSFKWFDIES